jgi:hypothetical protein
MNFPDALIIRFMCDVGNLCRWIDLSVPRHVVGLKAGYPALPIDERQFERGLLASSENTSKRRSCVAAQK